MLASCTLTPEPLVYLLTNGRNEVAPDKQFSVLASRRLIAIPYNETANKERRQPTRTPMRLRNVVITRERTTARTTRHLSSADASDGFEGSWWKGIDNGRVGDVAERLCC